MADIVNMIVEEMVAQLQDNTSLGLVVRAPMAEHTDAMEASGVAAVGPNAPDDKEWRHEINTDRLQLGMLGLSHRPWKRRFYVRVMRVYIGSDRETAEEDFGGLMREIEAVMYGTAWAVGPDDNGERLSGCTHLVRSQEEYEGGETEYIGRGMVWVEFHTD